MCTHFLLASMSVANRIHREDHPMLAINTILHPTDFSEHSGYALPLACALARDYGARLVVLHVVSYPPVLSVEGVPPPDPVEVRGTAQDQLAHLHMPADDVRAERRLEEGSPALEIMRVADE